MSLQDLVNLTITAKTSAPTRLGFGIPLLLCYHAVSPDLLIPCSTPQAVVDAGFTTTSAAYKAAQVAFSQNPRPAQVIIGKRTRAFTRVVRLVPIDVTQGHVYTFTVVDIDGTETPIEYVIPGAATVASICAALVTLIDAITGVAATPVLVSAVAVAVAVTCAAGEIFDLKNLPSPRRLEIQDKTTDPGIASDLADIELEDGTSWYGVCLDSQSPAEIAAAAAWVEARRKVMICNTTDTEVLKSATTTDVGSVLKTAGYARTSLLFSRSQIQSYSALGWVGCQLPKDPGSSTWKFKKIKGCPSDTFTDSQITGMRAKNVNFYNVVGGLAITEEGYSAAGEFIDITHGVDWLYARIQEAVFGLMASVEKIPYTNKGVDSITAVILGVLERGVKAGLLVAGTAVVTAPKVEDVDVALRAIRKFPDIAFSATLAGAIHSVDIDGIVSV